MAFCIEQPRLFTDRSGRIAGWFAGRCRISCIMQGHAGQNAGFLAGRARAVGLALYSPQNNGLKVYRR